MHRVIPARSEGCVSACATENLGPCRKVRLRPLLFHDETCDRGRENPAATEVEPAGQARIKAGAIRIARAGHVDHFAGANPRDSNSAVARNDEASSRSARGHNDLCGLEEPFGGRDRKSTRLNSSHRTISYAV